MQNCSRKVVQLLGLVVLVLFVSAVGAQLSQQPHHRIGLPQDWTHRHVLFSRSALSAYPALLQVEPRAVHQLLRQNPVRLSLASTTSDTTDTARDWSVALGAGRVAPGMYPAKYGFDTTATPSCANDYVVFPLNIAGSATQANLIAFNNLYSGTGGYCPTGPTVLFSYNVSTAGGRIATSPILSLDGTKIGFVETTGSSAIFHVLTWKTGTGNGTSATTPALPGVGNTASMISIPFGTAPDTRSSPWIDYNSDTVYVGNNAGRVYKFTTVLKGTPTLAGSPWPVVASSGILTAPVLDNVSKNIFVGDGQGRLISFNSVTPGTPATFAVGKVGATDAQILDPPMVDGTNGVVYAISGNDGNSAVLVEASTSNLAQIARANIGIGGVSGTTVTLYDGSPDNNYFNSISSGTFLVCGTDSANTFPVLYTFGFTGTTLNTTPISTTQLSTNNGARCSPITEFFNPNIGTGGTDFFFFGLTSNCVGTRGCIMSKPIPGAPPLPVTEIGGTSGIVIDNQSTLGQASSIYFGNLAGTSTAVKLTQNGLN